MSIKDMEVFDRPREKIVNDGICELSDVELLAIILRSGTKSESVLELSSRVLKITHGIKSLSTYTLEKLMEIKGIKLAKSTAILASFELAKRSYAKIPVNYILETSLDTFTIMNSLMSNLTEEHLYALYLDTKSKLISRELISKGDLKTTTFNVNNILRIGLMLNANGVILVHNHPSGESRPSDADLDVTSKISNALKLVSLVLLDHIIIGAGNYYSFFDNKRL